MTEAEWLACTDPEPMLEFLRGKASERKLRLFTVACCRGIWHLISDSRSRQAVETVERAVDGNATEQEQAAFDGGRYFEARSLTNCLMSAVGAAGWSVSRRLTPTEASHCAAHAWQAVVHNATASGEIDPQQLADDERYEVATEPLRQSTKRDQASLLRDIFGLLIVRSVGIDLQWLSWNNDTVVKITQTIYEDRTFDHLPLLADALEEADCSDADILGHLRVPGPHVRGCWVVDLLLGKE
jgi:hypothetical protein